MYEKQNKTCTKCRVTQPILSFHKDRHTKDGFYSQCRACCAQKWALKPGRPKKDPKDYARNKPITEKLCRGCNKILPVDSFYRRNNRNEGRSLYARCKSCNSSSFASWSTKHPGQSRIRNLKAKYGISEEKYFEFYYKQNSSCGICGSKESGWKTSPWLHVDHCHVTGIIRGLLCHQCNVMIGMIEKQKIDDLTVITLWLNKHTTIFDEKQLIDTELRLGQDRNQQILKLETELKRLKEK